MVMIFSIFAYLLVVVGGGDFVSLWLPSVLPATARLTCPVMHQQLLISAHGAAKLASPSAGSALGEKLDDLTVLVINALFLLLLSWTLAMAL